MFSLVEAYSVESHVFARNVTRVTLCYAFVGTRANTFAFRALIAKDVSSDFIAFIKARAKQVRLSRSARRVVNFPR